MLQRLGTHKFIDDLATALQEVAGEVVRTGNKGKVTVSLTVTPADDGLSVIVSEEIKPTRPVNSPRGAIFVALDGQLFDSDPRQLSFNFSEVNRTTGEVQTANGQREA